METLAAALDRAMDATIVPGFSRIGYAVRQRQWDPVDDDLTGSVVLVTGATSGIGFAAARSVARLGAAVRTIGRDQDRGHDAVERLRSASGNDDIGFDVVDMGDLEAVRRYAARFGEREGRLDTLVHNAGALFPERHETEAGVETTLAVHLLGPYLLTRGLEDVLARSAPSRVVWMSSGGMYTAALDLEKLEATDPELYDGRSAYARAKRAQVVLSGLLADEYADRGISVIAMHPGWVRTPGVTAGLPTFDKVMRPLLRTPEQGADTLVWLVAGNGETGRFYHDRAARPTHKTSRTRADDDSEAQLITWIEQRIALADT